MVVRSDVDAGSKVSGIRPLHPRFPMQHAGLGAVRAAFSIFIPSRAEQWGI